MENINNNDNVENTSNFSLQQNSKAKVKNQNNIELLPQKRKREIDIVKEKNGKVNTSTKSETLPVIVPKVYLKKEKDELSFDIDKVLRENNKNPWDTKGRFSFHLFLYFKYRARYLESHFSELHSILKNSKEKMKSISVEIKFVLSKI
jgi:hypothetical protein